MNGLITMLEALDGKVLPPILLTAFAALAIFLLYRFLSGRRQRGSDWVGSARSTSGSSESYSALKSEWIAKRDYKDTLRAGPQMQGTFQSWFPDELKICEAFRRNKSDLERARDLNVQEYPKSAETYLAIVGEQERKPHTAWIFVGLLLLMAVEATGFSLIFADRLSDTASAQAIERYAYGIAIVLAVLALYFAHKIGVGVYRQSYARQVHLAAPNRSLHRTSGRTLDIEDSAEDKDADQSTRIANRSDYVHYAAGKAALNNELTPRFTPMFWIYVAGVLVFGAIIGVTRVAQIDEFYAKEAKSALDVQKAAIVQSPDGRTSRPPSVAQSTKDAEDVVTQEALDVERRGKVLAILIFVAIFYVVQALGVVLAGSRGFASTKGIDAFDRIAKFRRRYGHITFDQFAARVRQEIDQADMYAQDTLHSWQIGLQTAFKNKAMPVPNEPFFEKAVTDFSERAYSTYLQIKATEGVSEIQRIKVLTSSHAERHDGAPQQLVDFYNKSIGGQEKLETVQLQELKSKVADGELDAAGLMVRTADQPGRYLTYHEYMNSLRALQ